MGTLWQDMRYGFRMVARNPGFTAVVVVTLAVGIGANTAIFSFLDRVLLRPLPVKKPHELVKVEFRVDDGGTDDAFNHPLYASYREETQVFSGLAAYGGDMVNLAVGDSAEQVMGMAVSDNYFSVLGVKPALGRTLLPREDQTPGAHAAAVISDAFWQRRFGGDPAAVGGTIVLDNYPLTVVGVMPPEFTGTVVGVGPAVYVPLGTWAYARGITLENSGYTWLTLLGRLQPGVSRPQAEAALRVLTEQIKSVQPTNTHTEVLLADGSGGTNIWVEEGWWWQLALLQTPAVLVLLVACANVANMLLARGMTRQKEIAIRRAMGARRSVIVRQLLVESMLLAVLSGACGALLAHWLSLGLRSALTVASALNMPVGVDGRILAFALLGSLCSVLFFGLAPALRLSRPQIMPTLKDSSGMVAVLARSWNLRNFLVITQIAVSVIVLALGTLCVRSLGRLRLADPGFDAARVLGVSMERERGSVPGISVAQLSADLKDRIAALPSVQAVSLAGSMPLASQGRNKTGVEHIDGFQKPADQEYISLDYAMVSPGHFQTLGIPLLRGREFSAEDGPGAPRVMIINELMAQRYWPNQNPVGKQVVCCFGDVREVVGVVQTVKLNSIREAPVPMMFWPLAQPMKGVPVGDTKPILLLRTAGDPKAVIPLVRKALDSLGVNPATCRISSLSERAWDLLATQRTIAGLLNVVGLVGLLFVGTGIFALMAFEVGRRTQEIGVRMALGAQWRDVLRLVLLKGAVLTVVGLAVGMGLSCVPMWVLSRLLPEIRMWDAYFLYGVHLWDPLTYAGVALLICLVALVACWLPARRAARIDPMAALRCE